MGRQHQRYILDCPNCGRVEGVGQTGREDLAATPGESDEAIEQRVVEDAHGHPLPKVRCPRCGTWVEADRAHPLDTEARGRERRRDEQ